MDEIDDLTEEVHALQFTLSQPGEAQQELFDIRRQYLGPRARHSSEINDASVEENTLWDEDPV
eukprot:m.258080 g.258080  ORF g.258080 m.258080 type:complete len:63 (+) comp28682_c0_seq1:145-333(+)